MKLNPYYVTGFTDAEGTFALLLLKGRGPSGLGLSRLIFKIGVHIRDKELIERIAAYFGVGKVYADHPESCQYLVQSIADVGVIVKHFEEYPLITQKRGDFELFRQAYYMILAKEHLTMEGFQKYLNLRASINGGKLFQAIQAEFPDIISLPRPSFVFEGIPDSFWLSGFTDGDGCFRINVRKSAAHKFGVCINLGFILTQHIRDLVLIQSLVGYLNCGGSSIATNSLSCEYHVYCTTDILNIILPFFNKYPLQGIKRLDFNDFVIAAKILEGKGHLTESGYQEIIALKEGMNRGRYSPPKPHAFVSLPLQSKIFRILGGDKGNLFFNCVKKKLTIKNFLLYLVIILAVWVSKCCFLSFFSEINTILFITGSIIGYLVKILFSSFIEIMDFELKLPLSDNPAEKVNSSSNNSPDCNRLFKDNGEGSSKNPKSTKNEIGWEDYYFSESESESEHTHPTNQSSKITGDVVETFKQKVGNFTTKEEVSSTKKEVVSALEQYESSGRNVPAFKEQVSALKEKLNICDNKLSELENQEKTEGKGKGKELLENNFSPRRVLNPNYQPAPRGGLTQHVDYSYDSDEEEEAVRRAIEESLKSNSSKEDSSSKGKGKDE